MRLYTVKDEYINFLRKYDTKVAENKNHKRPYVGVLIEVDGIKYYAPLTSPKEKHKHMKNSKDFRRINKGIYGAVNFNNMIPVRDDAINLIDFNSIEDIQYRRLLQNQYNYILLDKVQIMKTAAELRKMIFTSDDKLESYEIDMKKRCCNLPVLESVVDLFTNAI